MHDELNVNGHILHYHTFVFYLFVLFSFILFFYHRCWDLSAGNLKWIYQVPILVAVVVSTCSSFPPVVLKSKSISLHLCDDSSNDTNTTFSVCN